LAKLGRRTRNPKKQFCEPGAFAMKKSEILKYRPSPNHPSEEKVLAAMAFNQPRRQRV
jgi:hypothetical protein